MTAPLSAEIAGTLLTALDIMQDECGRHKRIDDARRFVLAEPGWKPGNNSMVQQRLAKFVPIALQEPVTETNGQLSLFGGSL